jgi:hypothetical protein
MKTNSLRWMTILPLAAALGCGNTQPEPQPQTPGQVERTVRAALTGFTFDSTELAQAPSGPLPTALLRQTAFSDANIQRSLLQTTEPFTVSGELATRTELDSQSWHVERDAQNGRVLVVRKHEGGAALPQDEALLQRGSLERLQRWGIPSGELGPIRQVQLLAQAQDGSLLEAPATTRYKTFVMRAINGIRVEGHRAVVTHSLDGTFQRAVLKWPAIATGGHRLYTRLTPAEIETRATDALVRAGELGGPVRLSWKYVPTQLTSGEVSLTLMVSASMPSLTDSDGTTEEPRVVDVDVSAL